MICNGGDGGRRRWSGNEQRWCLDCTVVMTAVDVLEEGWFGELGIFVPVIWGM